MDTIYFIMNKEGTPQKPTHGYAGDAGWDLYTSEMTVIGPGQLVDVPTGIRVALPNKFFGRITGRSSTLRTHGLIISEGIIDNGWRGELYINAYNVSRETATLYAGDRIAQLLVHRVYDMEWVQTSVLSSTGRNAQGFGSTGR